MKSRRWRRVIGTSAALTPALAVQVALAQSNFVRQVDAADKSGQTTFVIEMQSPIQGKPLDFITEKPARIAFDFDDTGFAAGRARYKYDSRLLNGADVIETGGRTRVVLDLKRSVPYRTAVQHNKLVVTLDPPAALAEAPGMTAIASGKDAAPSSYGGQRMTLNFQNVSVRSLLQVFGEFTGLNIVTSDAVQGNLTLRLNDVPWDQALQIVLDAKGLDSRRNGNVIWIAPKAELAEKEKLEFESRHQVSELEPLRSEVYRLNYQRADDVRRMLVGDSGAQGALRMLSKRGALTADTRTNQLFVSDVASKLEEVRAFIAKIDIPVRQVLIEARIVEANDTFSRNLGVKLGFAARSKGANYGSEYGNVLPGFANAGDGSAGSVPPAVSLPAAGLVGANPAALAFSLFNANASRFLALELTALEADGKGKIISSPRVVTADNIKALIEQGTELPYQAATSSGATSVSFKKANLKLEVTPQITPEGKVILDVDVNKDSRGISTPSGFAIDTKHVRTQVLVDNGGTVMIGGIFMEDEGNQNTKVPLLGDIPVLGHLFKSNERVRDRKELLVFLTPRIHADLELEPKLASAR
ncbi:type IV pilus secretin PilQ [Cupriavidus plantarum]|uniref:Type IV pilus biogenesis and competence protein PilQ n=1 Tax=Cupriavidus plantarum TaxID=942865 RepID=A0A316EW42_9BURK|nr:type IV pilus secretin PilQ [Cupriavidus plantarum]NYI00978.1 type IV pilus assembly protein PilQ [Cupriavidus plantarum]PWK35389.1 type IV pilus secretin PilQ/predicted competence protein [Cupriavidus plantarum]REE93843.1 type IV pilus secretin PilQ/predicted competence protein [Cupriavidus plantarum]RLK39254.1 type IV pilus secretin PilQ/predicted competence protein [Cupriavidus plantarum]CAG2134460.1 Type 3 secretion system secretin [Cupriavidus plantarum]